MTERRKIAAHKATDTNPAWRIEHVTGAGGIDEYSLDIGDGWLVLDPRDPDDRAQMVEIGNALLAAAGVPDTGAVLAGVVEQLTTLSDEWQELPASREAVKGVWAARGFVKDALRAEGRG